MKCLKAITQIIGILTILIIISILIIIFTHEDQE